MAAASGASIIGLLHPRAKPPFSAGPEIALYFREAPRMFARRTIAATLLSALGALAPAAGQEQSSGLATVEGWMASAARSEIDAELRARVEEAMRSGAYDRAEALLLEAREAQPESAEVLRLLGGVFFVKGSLLQAAVALKKAEALAPLDERSRFTLAMAYVALGRRDWARPELETLAGSHPRTALYPYWLARLDYDQTKYEAAIEKLQRAIGLDPGFAKAFDNLGLCYEALGRVDEAIRAWQEAIRLNREAQPPSPWPALNLGLLLARLGQLEEAEARFRESLATDPEFPQAHYQLGLVLEKTGRPEQALPELEAAARLEPGYPEPHYALARVYRRAGDREKASRALERFRELKEQQQSRAEPQSR